MKKIITAIGNEKLVRRIKEEINCEISCKDILYGEGIFEYLENDKNIDFIILNIEILLIENIDKFVEKINKYNKNIKIIFLIQNKNGNMKEYNNVIYININNYVFKNIEKELIKNDNENYIEIDKNNYIDKIIEKSDNIKIISIAGSNGVGKSVFTACFAKYLEKKILIIDFDFFNNSIHTLFGVKRSENEITNVNKNIDLISTEEMYCRNKYEIKTEYIIEMIENLKNNYDYILIDTSSELFFDCTKEILKYSDCIIFLIESNLLELKKSINLLKIYKENWNIENSKIKILINKINKNSINKKISEKIFFENEIIGEIKYNEKYNLFINKNMKNIKEKIFFKNKYKNILNKIISNEKIIKNKGENKNGFRNSSIKMFRTTK